MPSSQSYGGGACSWYACPSDELPPPSAKPSEVSDDCPSLQVDAVDMRYWRSARLGNALTADTSPPPDQYMPDLWPEVHAFVHSVVQVRTATNPAHRPRTQSKPHPRKLLLLAPLTPRSLSM